MTTEHTPTWGEVALGLLVMPFTTVFHSYLFSICWRWFAVGPLGAPPLRVVDAIGVSLLVHWFTVGIARRGADKPMASQIVNSVLTAATLFGLAAVVHAFQ